jgi:dCTP deaminase
MGNAQEMSLFQHGTESADEQSEFHETEQPRARLGGIGTGIFPSQMLSDFVDTGKIISPEPLLSGQIQPASIDLRLGKVGYEVRASFLPGNATVESKIRGLLIRKVSLEESTVFAPNSVFIVPLVESLALPPGISGKANPKSTTGRLDIFIRLLTEAGKDAGREFELVPKGYRGALYAEIVSRTFPVVIRAGMRLNQLRLMRGNSQSSDSKLTQLAERENLLYEDEESPRTPHISRGMSFSVDLEGDDSNVVAYKARKNTPPIDLDKINFYQPDEYWEVVRAPRSKQLILNPQDFYILASSERVGVPPTHAAEMVAFDPAFGEFRIHYAGFFDPGFGHGVNGTKAVLEVRAHEVPTLLEHGQVVGRLVYHAMAQLPEKVYGAAIGSSYQKQGLTLSKQFVRDLPNK